MFIYFIVILILEIVFIILAKKEKNILKFSMDYFLAFLYQYFYIIYILILRYFHMILGNG